MVQSCLNQHSDSTSTFVPNSLASFHLYIFNRENFKSCHVQNVNLYFKQSLWGADWTKINNLVFTDFVLHYSQKDLDFENNEPIKKCPPFKEISAPIMGDHDEQGVRAQIGTDENVPYC